MDQINLRVALARKGITQIQCARDLGWSHTKLNYFARGYYEPSHGDKERLAAYLELSVEELFPPETLEKGLR